MTPLREQTAVAVAVRGATAGRPSRLQTTPVVSEKTPGTLEAVAFSGHLRMNRKHAFLFRVDFCRTAIGSILGNTIGSILGSILDNILDIILDMTPIIYYASAGKGPR